MPDIASHIGDILASVFMSLIGYAGILLSGNVTSSSMSTLIIIVSVGMVLIGITVSLLSILGIAKEKRPSEEPRVGRSV
jgi:hypothetical protein